MKTDKNDKIVIKQFRDGSSNFWVDTVHYSLTQEGTIIFCAGGLDKEELRDVLNAYIKRNKKVFKDRSESIFNTVEKEYKEVLNFGKFSGKTVQDIFYEDKKYLQWMLKNYNFTHSQSKLKEQITEILKK
jgi:hypothetical protein